jgi:DNA-binding response OmpR family regulator
MTKILLVEDHPELRHVLGLQLERMGFIAITAENGKEGVETAVAEKPDLILILSCQRWMVGKRPEYCEQILRLRTFRS